MSRQLYESGASTLDLERRILQLAERVSRLEAALDDAAVTGPRPTDGAVPVSADPGRP
jgi:hypothetical protein